MEEYQLQKETKETQTVYEEGDFEIPCKECIYEASCEEELIYHIQKEHEVSNINLENKFSSEECYKKFDVKYDLTMHMRNIHETKNNICKYYLKGKLQFW